MSFEKCKHGWKSNSLKQIKTQMNLPSIYQLGSDVFKQLFRIQIQKGGKELLILGVSDIHCSTFKFNDA
jgi:hypothetical protein